MKNLQNLAVLGALFFGSPTTVLANRSTDNECWVNEDATYLGQYFDLFFDYADQYRMKPAGTCNVFTYSTTQVAWAANDLEAFYWQYYTGESPTDATANEEGGSNNPSEAGEDEFSDFKKADDTQTVLKRTLKQSEENEEVKIEGPPEGHEKIGLPDYCVAQSEIPQEYNEGTTLKTSGNFCGFKIQVRNKSTYAEYDFQVLRNSAMSVAFAATAGLITATSLAF